jgi:hypothetical protein
MILNVREARPDEVQFAWPLYSEFVRKNIFNDSPSRAARDRWNEANESNRFSEYWSKTGRYMIEIDDKVVGWMAAVETSGKITIENMFIVPEWQNKGIVERFMKEMTPVWRSKGLTIDVTLLKDGPTTAAISAMLKTLGYKTVRKEDYSVKGVEDSPLTEIMCTE